MCCRGVHERHDVALSDALFGRFVSEICVQSDRLADRLKHHAHTRTKHNTILRTFAPPHPYDYSLLYRAK